MHDENSSLFEWKILRDNRLIFFEALLNLTSSLDLILTTGGGVEELTLMLVTKLEWEDIISLLEAISASFSASSLRYKSSNSSIKETEQIKLTSTTFIFVSTFFLNSISTD